MARTYTYIPYRNTAPRSGNNPDDGLLGIIARLRAIAADPTFNAADREDARQRARQLLRTVGDVRRRERAMT